MKDLKYILEETFYVTITMLTKYWVNDDTPVIVKVFTFIIGAVSLYRVIKGLYMNCFHYDDM